MKKYRKIWAVLLTLAMVLGMSMTTMAAAKATISGIQSLKKPGCGEVRSLQELHSEIKDK